MRAQLTAGSGDPLELVARAKEASSQAIADLRTVVYSLRPPALDDLGVVGAITAQVRRMAEGSTVDIEVEDDGLPALPAAVEVALFRIAVEGVTNVVRHAEARWCRVLLGGVDGSAVVEVVDDGASDLPWTPGVGTVAMRERVTELGGTLEIGPAAEGGRLRASFPLPETAGGGAGMTTDGIIRVVIVDDHSLVRQGLEAVLASAEDVARGRAGRRRP